MENGAQSGPRGPQSSQNDTEINKSRPGALRSTILPCSLFALRCYSPALRSAVVRAAARLAFCLACRASRCGRPACRRAFPLVLRLRSPSACPSPLRLRRPVAPGVGPPGLACGLLSPFPAASCASVAEYFASLNANLPAKYFSRSSTRLYASMRWKIILRPRSALSQNFFF